MVNNFGNSVISNVAKSGWGNNVLKYGRESVKIVILCANATFRMNDFDLRLTCIRQYCSM